MAFGDQLKKIRKKKGWTQPTLSEKSKISLPQIRRYEGNHTSPTSDLIRKLALTLNVTIDELFFDENELSNETGVDRRLLWRMREVSKVPEKEKESLIVMLDALIFRYQVNQLSQKGKNK